MTYTRTCHCHCHSDLTMDIDTFIYPNFAVTNFVVFAQCICVELSVHPSTLLVDIHTAPPKNSVSHSFHLPMHSSVRPSIFFSFPQRTNSQSQCQCQSQSQFQCQSQSQSQSQSQLNLQMRLWSPRGRARRLHQGGHWLPSLQASGPWHNRKVFCPRSHLSTRHRHRHRHRHRGNIHCRAFEER